MGLGRQMLSCSQDGTRYRFPLPSCSSSLLLPPQQHFASPTRPSATHFPRRSLGHLPSELLREVRPLLSCWPSPTKHVPAAPPTHMLPCSPDPHQVQLWGHRTRNQSEASLNDRGVNPIIFPSLPAAKGFNSSLLGNLQRSHQILRLCLFKHFSPFASIPRCPP